jgi:hypothetical protein
LVPGKNVFNRNINLLNEFAPAANFAMQADSKLQICSAEVSEQFSFAA